MLYEEDAVVGVAALRAHAAKGLGGGSGMGVGILGTPSMEFAAEVAALSLIGGLLSNAVQKTALEFLSLAQERHEMLSSRGTFFDVSEISNAHLPRPSAWSSLGPISERLIPVFRISKIEQEALLHKYRKSFRDVVEGSIKVRDQPRYIYNGDEFVFVDTDVGQMGVRWSQVVAYRPSQPAP